MTQPTHTEREGMIKYEKNKTSYCIMLQYHIKGLRLHSPICSSSISNTDQRAAGVCSSGSLQSALRALTWETKKYQELLIMPRMATYLCAFLYNISSSHCYVHLLLEVASGRSPMRAWWPLQPASHTDWQTAREMCSRLEFQWTITAYKVTVSVQSALTCEVPPALSTARVTDRAQQITWILKNDPKKLLQPRASISYSNTHIQYWQNEVKYISQTFKRDAVFVCCFLPGWDRHHSRA